jgi:hypothetical protein
MPDKKTLNEDIVSYKIFRFKPSLHITYVQCIQRPFMAYMYKFYIVQFTLAHIHTHSNTRIGYRANRICMYIVWSNQYGLPMSNTPKNLIFPLGVLCVKIVIFLTIAVTSAAHCYKTYGAVDGTHCPKVFYPLIGKSKKISHFSNKHH